jgi:anti-sigma B factor antagonist
MRAERVGGAQVVRLEGELDKLGVQEVHGALRRLADEGPVVLDLDRVTFIDSAGLHALFSLGRVPGTGVAVAVADGSPTAKVIALVRLGDMLPVRPTVDEAVAALRRGSQNGHGATIGADAVGGDGLA